MKKRFLTLAILMAVGIFAAGLAGAQQPAPSQAPPGESVEPQPRLDIEAPVFDAGEIGPGTLVKHEFVIKNTGRAPLEIKEVKPGCGCAVADFDRIVEPGASGKINITIRVYPEWAGQHIRKAAWVLTNDPVSPQARVVVEGQVRRL